MLKPICYTNNWSGSIASTKGRYEEYRQIVAVGIVYKIYYSIIQGHKIYYSWRKIELKSFSSIDIWPQNYQESFSVKEKTKEIFRHENKKNRSSDQRSFAERKFIHHPSEINCNIILEKAITCGLNFFLFFGIIKVSAIDCTFQKFSSYCFLYILASSYISLVFI